MTIFDNVVNLLKTNGYKVNTQPQEKQLIVDQRELIVLVSDINVEVESTTTYIFETECTIIFPVETSEELLSKLPIMMNLIESNLGFVCGFRFLKPDVKLLGTMYNIGLKFSYKEMVNIE